MKRKHARLRVKLPDLGVGIGRLQDDQPTVVINNGVHYSEFDAVGIVPVIRTSDRSVSTFSTNECSEPFSVQRYRLYRHDAADDQQPPRASDVGRFIETMQPIVADAKRDPRFGGSTYEKARAETRDTKLASTSLQLDALWGSRAMYRPISSYDRLPVPRRFWLGPDEVGVLFVLVLGATFAEKDDENATLFAAALADLLARENVERCVVPKLAVAPDVTSESEFCFAFGSCQYTAGIIDSTPRPDGNAWPIPGPADKSYARLARHVRTPVHTARPELLIIAGDHVYVDGTAGLFDPAIDDGKYMRPYEQLYSSVYVQDVARQIPVCAMLDDHEIVDNWEDEDDEAREARRLGVQAYYAVQRRSGPLPPGDPNIDPPRLWTPFQRAGYQFFFADTRTGRAKRTAADYSRQHMISDVQMQQLKQWLLAGKDSRRPRFVISPSILVPRRMTSRVGRGALHSDAWDGYPRSHTELLNYIAANQINNVVFLSGDEHLCVTAYAQLREQPPGSEVVVRSIHSSGMYAPFPFANSMPEDLVPADILTTNQSHRWTVKSSYAAGGNGFALISVRPQAGAYTVTVRFALDHDPRGDLVHWQFTI